MMAPLSQPGCLNHEISKIQNKRKRKRTRVGPNASATHYFGFWVLRAHMDQRGFTFPGESETGTQF